MDWVTELPPSFNRSYNACLFIVDRYRKTHIFLPCHMDDTAIDTALLPWNRFISHTGLFKNIISERDFKLTSELWTNLHRFFGTKLPFSTAYHTQMDGLAESIIQTLEDMIRRFLELEYKTSVHSSTGKTPAILEKGWNPRIPAETLRKDLVYIHPTASSFKMMLDKVKQHAKQKWDKSHKVPDSKLGYLVLVSTLNFNNIKGPKKLKDSYAGPFVIVALHGSNAFQVELSGELENKHPTFPVSLIKPYQPADKELFPVRNPNTSTLSQVKQSENKEIKKGDLGVNIKENILSDIEIQYMRMNGWQNQRYLTQLNS
ncbi:hypothetical protein O181_038633 [Austropuccinia psidii MF-1]|uniref:Tf2-1-like SH3-like domain-containing protein n=1 Tax=Austropuccinia psidii MF-1 TaxID=1389203 RepID=A0A9Q3DBT2_9BASI|nr:hypothetical protein [Austropuccinia psidii MF-1]